MLFMLSKVILFVLLPPASLIIVMALGVLLIRRYPRLAKAFIVFGLSVLYLLSIRPISDALIRPLESSFLPLKASSINSANVIVVLTGGVADLSWRSISPQPSRTSLSRLVYGVTLYKQVPGTNIIISGGSGDPEKQNISEADAMKDMAIALGVPAKDMLIERDSRNTIESVNALRGFVGKSMVLVTSASHMKRAVAMFKKMGMNVVPAPTDYMSEQKKVSLYSLIPTANHLLTSSTAFYEYISFIWYRVNGKV